VTATHKRNFHVFQKGELASDGVAAVAEDAHNAPLVSALSSSAAVYDVEVGGGPILPGNAVTFTIKTKLGFNRISMISMLVNTNDGFTGIDAIPLPLHGSRTIFLPSYDAGSEKNTELKAHIPGPCCGNPFQGIDTAEPIKFHEGIEGVGDLDPAVYDWDEPTAKLTVTRIE
jgi:hypothetical protein